MEHVYLLWREPAHVQGACLLIGVYRTIDRAKKAVAGIVEWDDRSIGSWTGISHEWRFQIQMRKVFD